MPPTSGPKLPDPLADRFTVVETYGGGEGWSGLVREDGGDAQVLKILDPGADLAEASLLGSLRHPQIPAVVDVGRTSDGRAFLVREYVAGQPLDACLPMPADAALELARQLLEILAFVHLRGVLHLDVKPANVIRADTEHGPRYALLDFGLGARGGAASGGGTPVFAAPERLLGLQPDARADLFSLGALLFVALRGPRAIAPRRFLESFPGRDFFQAAGVAPNDLPSPFDTWLPRLLDRRVHARFGDAQEALEALTHEGSGRPSLELLRTDPIALHGGELSAATTNLAATADLQIDGGTAADRRALALHASHTLTGVVRIDDGPTSCTLRRGGGGEVSHLTLAPLRTEQIGRHLETALHLDAEIATHAADLLSRAGHTTAQRLGDALVRLAEADRIVPAGTQWAWPEAASGRLDLPRDDDRPITPVSLRETAARGGVERALRAYRETAAAAPTADDERTLRAALVEGLLIGGEAARALPLTADLPLPRARALLDIGRVRDAERALAALGEPDTPGSMHLRACVAYADGRPSQAAALASRLDDAPESRIVHGLALIGLGRPDEALTLLGDVVERLDPAQRPFLRAAALTNLAQAARQLGRPREARTHLTEAFELYRSLGHARHTATASLNLGVLAKDDRRFAAARTHLRQARTLFGHIDDRTGTALSEVNLGVVALETGDPTTARRKIGDALAELERLGAVQSRALLQLLLARAHAALGDRDEARRLLDAAGPAEEKRLQIEAELVRNLLEGPTSTPATEDQPVTQTAPTPPSPDGVPREVFRTFLAINRRLAGEADLQRAMDYLLEAAVTLTGGRLGYLLVARADGVRMEVSSAQSDPAHAFSRSMVNRAMQTGRVLTAEDALADRELLEMRSVRDLEQRSAICVPFVCSSGTHGALYVEHPNRAGAFDATAAEHLETLADQAAIAVDRMLNEEALAAELERSRRDLAVARRALRPNQRRMLGASKPVNDLRKQIDRVATSDLPVLILGESGTGKELVARALHEQSARHGASFVALNCAAIPAELLESELFGHTRGAFTGADDEQTGLLELASGGTLFLDEIGDMPLPMQAKLLRALQDQVVRPIGSHATIQIDLRVVAATHRDLRAAIANNEFREDLYYRLAAVELRIPPLRERGEDILLLADEFLARLNTQHRRTVHFSEATRRSLLDYPWPGNVRELEHVIARAFLLADDDELRAVHLPDVARAQQVEATWPVLSLQEAEARTIHAALESTGGDKSKAARILGISRTALYEKLKRIEKRRS